MGSDPWVVHVAGAFDWVGAAVLALGFIWSVVVAARTAIRQGGATAYRRLRATFGGVLLLGLEILVAADLVRTIAVAPTLQNVLVLGIVVVIRTFLSFSLQVEIDGSLPWRRAKPTPQPSSRGGK